MAQTSTRQGCCLEHAYTATTSDYLSSPPDYPPPSNSISGLFSHRTACPFGSRRRHSPSASARPLYWPPDFHHFRPGHLISRQRLLSKPYLSPRPTSSSGRSFSFLLSALQPSSLAASRLLCSLARFFTSPSAPHWPFQHCPNHDPTSHVSYHLGSAGPGFPVCSPATSLTLPQVSPSSLRRNGPRYRLFLAPPELVTLLLLHLPSPNLTSHAW